MIAYKEYTHYIFTIFMIIGVILFSIPNLSSNLNKYQSQIKVIKDVKIKDEGQINYFQKSEPSLVLEMIDGTEIKLSSQYGKYWNELLKTENIGKKIKFYLGNNTTYGSNPVQIEIENKIIYSVDEGAKFDYILIIIAIGMSLYSATKLIRYIKSNKKK